MDDQHYIHFEFDAAAGDLIEVTKDNPANVQLLDPENYEKYRNGQEFRYHGGYATSSSVRLKPPHPGKWHVVVDLGGGPGRVRAYAQLLPESWLILNG